MRLGDATIASMKRATMVVMLGALGCSTAGEDSAECPEVVDELERACGELLDEENAAADARLECEAEADAAYDEDLAACDDAFEGEDAFDCRQDAHGKWREDFFACEKDNPLPPTQTCTDPILEGHGLEVWDAWLCARGDFEPEGCEDILDACFG